MDRGDFFSKALAEKLQNLQVIREKLLEPEYQHISQRLEKTEYQSIGKALLEKPDLFLLLLNIPAFDLCLTENTREGFLKDLQENPDKIKAKALVMQKQETEQSSSQVLQNSTDSAADKEVDIVQDVKETINEVYEQIANFAAVYTPSLSNVTDTFNSLVEGLTCALPTIEEEPADGVQAGDTVEQGSIARQKKLTSTSK